MDDSFKAGDDNKSMKLFADENGLWIVCQSKDFPEPIQWLIKKSPVSFLEAAHCIYKVRLREKRIKFKESEAQIEGWFSRLPSVRGPRFDKCFLCLIFNDRDPAVKFEVEIDRFYMPDIIVRIQDYFNGPNFTMGNCIMTPSRIAVD
jgi:hypothetical protein